MTALADLRVRSIRAMPVMVPLNFVLGTSAGVVRVAPLLLVDLDTDEGITGRAYQFCYVPAAARALIRLPYPPLAKLRSPQELVIATLRGVQLPGEQLRAGK